MRLAGRIELQRLLPVLLLAAAACGTSAGQSIPTPTPTAGTPLTTAVLVASTNAPLRVLGSDGQEHLEYDLILTNVLTAPATLTAIDVLGPDGAPLLHLEGTDLAAQMQQLTGGDPMVPAEIPVSGTLATVMDVVLPAGEVPERLGHRISYTIPDVFAAAIIGSRTIDGPELAVDPRVPIVLAPPVRGPGWLNANGCCIAPAPHRLTRLVVDGASWRKIETFAIDWVTLREGRLFEGDGTRSEQWFAYGEEVVAAAAGTVVSMRDGVADQTPHQPPVGIQTPRDFAGNYVVIQIAPDVWAAYAHLLPGSVEVQVGDRVTVGQRLGLLGNTGNSSAPHLHFQLCDGPEILTSNSLPFVFSDYTLSGTIDGNLLGPAMNNPDAQPLVVTGPAQAQSDTHPLVLTVADFGG
ncbi:MAG TPA: M23 family metallopeptidase [Candidatus Dormibacteraeota bacterium]|nr:M23 family metallopeptidase [Candidatus Dormibacteraeota bacterium]